MSKRNKLKYLEPLDAVRMFDTAPDLVCIQVLDLFKFLGCSWPELCAELASGRLVAYSANDGPPKVAEAFVKGDEMLLWLLSEAPLAKKICRNHGIGDAPVPKAAQWFAESVKKNRGKPI